MYKACMVLLTCLLIASCSAQKEPIKIGVVLPLTGPFQIYGQQGLNGALLAVEDINQRGGVLGHPIELVVRDNQTDPALSVRLSRELIQIEDVFALLGPVSSAARYAMFDVANQFKIPMFYGIDYEGRHYNRYLVCYSTVPEHYVDPVIPYLIERSGDRFYIFGYDYIWPHRMSERIVAEVNRAGGKISGREFTAFNIKDYSAVFERINQAETDNLMLILPGADGFRFLEQMAEFKFSKPLKTVAFAADETYLNTVKPSALEGVISPLHFVSERQNPVFSRFVERYREHYGESASVTYSSKSHYDLILFLKGAMEKAGEVDRERMLDALEGLTLYSGESKVTLRGDNHFNLPMFLAEYQSNKLNVTKALGTIYPDDQRKVD